MRLHEEPLLLILSRIDEDLRLSNVGGNKPKMMKITVNLLAILFSTFLFGQEKPEFVDKPFVSINGGKPIAIEENHILATRKLSGKITRLMTSSEVPNTQIPNNAGYEFVIDLRNKEILQDLALYRLESVKGGLALLLDERKAQQQLAEKSVKLNFKELDGFYQIVPSKQLSPGDYAFTLGLTSFVFRVE